jgi:hypothetical protein
VLANLCIQILFITVSSDEVAPKLATSTLEVFAKNVFKHCDV